MPAHLGLGHTLLAPETSNRLDEVAAARRVFGTRRDVDHDAAAAREHEHARGPSGKTMPRGC
ncbi:MAG: hypothetical protein R3E87_18585 [Burkholderiaceae bacterium]